MGLKKAFGKECVATQSRWLLPKEVATLRREITKDILYKFACVLQKMGAPIVDLTNMIGEDQFTTKVIINCILCIVIILLHAYTN